MEKKEREKKKDEEGECKRRLGRKAGQARAKENMTRIKKKSEKVARLANKP